MVKKQRKVSAYDIYLKERMEEYKPGTDLKFREFRSKVAQDWKAQTEEGKAKYQAKADEENAKKKGRGRKPKEAAAEEKKE